MSADSDTTFQIRNVLKEIFDASAIQTLGDLAMQIDFPRLERLPASVRGYSLQPDNVFAHPDNYYDLMAEEGFTAQQAAHLVREAYEIKCAHVREAFDCYQAAIVISPLFSPS